MSGSCPALRLSAVLDAGLTTPRHCLDDLHGAQQQVQGNGTQSNGRSHAVTGGSSEERGGLASYGRTKGAAGSLSTLPDSRGQPQPFLQTLDEMLQGKYGL